MCICTIKGSYCSPQGVVAILQGVKCREPRRHCTSDNSKPQMRFALRDDQLMTCVHIHAIPLLSAGTSPPPYIHLCLLLITFVYLSPCKIAWTPCCRWCVPSSPQCPRFTLSSLLLDTLVSLSLRCDRAISDSYTSTTFPGACISHRHFNSNSFNLSQPLPAPSSDELIIHGRSSFIQTST